ncbi:MAG: lipid-binding SYLF domain-containing protein [Pirellulaceae bacterium]
MNSRKTLLLLAALTVGLGINLKVQAQGPLMQSREGNVVRSSITVLNEIMAIPARSIPASMLSSAEGIVIIPNMIKGGFVVGVRHGRGVVMVRDENRVWQAPQFVTMTGGSVGWQVGLQSTDVVLVFTSRKSIEGLLGGKFTVGVDAAAAAGPVGRQASAGTDLRLRSEIYSWNRSRGLFAGASIDGSSLQMDHLATNNFYGGGQAIPASASDLLTTVAAYADPQRQAGQVVQGGPMLTPAQPGVVVPEGQGIEQLRGDLSRSSTELAAMLPDDWKRFLALPTQVYEDGAHPSLNSLQVAAGNFATVSADPKFAQLTQRPEFRQSQQLLNAYVEALRQAEATPGQIQLPPPPGAVSQ